MAVSPARTVAALTLMTCVIVSMSSSAESKHIRIALFIGGGTGSANESATVLQDTINKGYLDGTVTLMSNTDIEDNLSTDEHDVVYFPGGSGSKEAAAITPKGIESVRAFVKSGGGYLGICAGGYLATANFSWSLHIIGAATKEPWDRGMGEVTIELNDLGFEKLGLSKTQFSGNVSIYYGQGPILVPGSFDDLPKFEVLAKYTSEIHSKHTNVTKGQMLGAPAISHSVYGQGRVLVSSPHPELTKPPIYPILASYLQFVTDSVPSTE